MLYFLLIGFLAGWLAGKIMRGRGFGVLGDILVGLVGAVLGGFILDLFGFARYGLLAQLITATLGAVLLIWIVRKIRK
jgi:uncharacterized membrane protein YeaQ/YmgE (transglycosylase-associated protein family)